MLIDLSNMKRIEVDPASAALHAQAGLTAGELDRATQRFELATVMGECASVGISGFTLGGGLGRLMGKYGVACDNLLSAELVTADGAVVRASAEENDALFWGLCGGGGNLELLLLSNIGSIISAGSWAER
jgi:FAD/FMN-containing dehydrogenase